jgi:uncharacterized protein (TIGR03437 family)
MKGILAVLALCASTSFAQQLAITRPQSPPAAVVNQAYSMQLAATGGTAPYSWRFQAGSSPSPRFSLSSSGLLSGSPSTADAGVLTFAVQVTDYTNAAATQQISITVLATQPLTLSTTSFPPAVVGAPYSFQLTGAGGTPPYTWSVLPAVVTLPVPGQVAVGILLNSSTGLVSGTPTSAGTFGFTITLTDSANGSVSMPFTITITPGGPLGIVTASLPGGILGAAYSQAIQGTGGFPPYKWSIAAGTLPSGLTLDPAAGVVSGAPLAVATSSFTVMATDSASPPNTAKQALSIAVVAPPPLKITTTSLPAGISGVPYSQQLAATGGVTPYTWSVTGGALPAGLSLAPSTGILSGAPTATGSFSFTIQAADNSAATQAKTTQAFTLTIAQLTQVSVSGGALASGTAGTPYSQTLNASGGAPPFTWSVIAGSLPPGLLVSASGTVSGVPSSAGAFAFTAQVVDASGATANGAFTLTVAGAPLTLNPLTLPSAVATVPYPSQVLTASGGAPPYAFSIVGALPSGLALATGLISGTPSATGTFPFTIMVTDSAKATATATQQIVVRSSLPADLVLSTGALSFSLATGASGLPNSQNLTVTSSSTGTVLSYQASVSPAAPWLTVAGGLNSTVSTPGAIAVSLNSQALSLMAGSYSTTLSVACMMPSACSGNVQKVAVTLAVSSPAPQLTLTKSLLALATGQTTGQFGIQNSGGGAITVYSVSAADSWLSLSGAPATVAAGPPTFVTATANTGALSAGLYRSTITVATSAGTANLPVSLLLTAGQIYTLNPAGQQFQMPTTGVVGNPAGSFEVLAGGSTVTWTAAVQPGASWLTVNTASGSSTPTSPGIVTYAINPVAAAALSTGTYYGTIRVSQPAAANSPQDFLVVLNVTSVNAGATPDDPEVQPGGLLFIANGNTAIPAQTATIYASSTAPIPYQAAAVTATGVQWLTVTPTSGTASAAAPGHPSVSVSPAGLAPGIYRGVVTYQFSPAAVRSLNVTYIIPNVSGGLPFDRSGNRPAESTHAGNCTPAALVVAPNGFPSNFSPQLAWPTPISVSLADDCGNTISSGTVDAQFDNNDPALPLQPDPATPGRYAGTWTPANPSAGTTVTVNATAAGLKPATVQMSGKLLPNVAPVVNPGAILNAFNQAPGSGVAPGTAVAIYGSNFALAGTSTIASVVPFATTLSNVSVSINGVLAPLYFVSPGQINAEVPFELQTGGMPQVVVFAGNVPTTPTLLMPAVAAPGIAAFANGSIIAQHLDASLITSSSPAKPGETIILYLTGLGSTANQPATGSPAPVPPTGPISPLTLTLNSVVTPTLFVGLTPGTIGLYQIDFTVPMSTPDGNLVLTVSQANVSSNVTLLPVHH